MAIKCFSTARNGFVQLWKVLVGVGRTVQLRDGLMAAHPTSPGLEKLDGECTMLLAHGCAIVTHCSLLTVLWFFACCAFMQLRATSCYFVMRIKTHGYREGMPLSRVFCVQLNAL